MVFETFNELTIFVDCATVRVLALARSRCEASINALRFVAVFSELELAMVAVLSLMSAARVDDFAVADRLIVEALNSLATGDAIGVFLDAENSKRFMVELGARFAEIGVPGVASYSALRFALGVVSPVGRAAATTETVFCSFFRVLLGVVVD